MLTIKFRHSLLFLIVASLLIGGCTLSSSRSNSHASISVARDFEDYNILVAETANTPLTLSLDFRVNQGTVSWSLIDPTGKTEWQGQLTAGERFKQTKRLPRMEGEWKFGYVVRQGAGEFGVSWNGFKRKR